jgi:RIP metalloprotease RseP
VKTTETEIEEAGSGWARAALLAVVIVIAGAKFGLWAILVALALVLMIFLHELGHYLTAKAAGMKVTEFFLGFGPKIWSFRKGETEYGVKAVPAGAYVKIIGMNNLEEVAPEDEARSYRSKPFGKRMPVILAGPLMNIALGLVLLFVVFATFGYTESSTTVGSVIPGSAAATSGVLEGDRIVAIDGQRVDGFDQVSSIVRANGGASVDVTVVRDGTEVVLPATIGWGLTSDVARDLGLRKGDRVTRVGDAEVGSYLETSAALARAHGPVTLSVDGSSGAETVVIQAPVVLPDNGSTGMLGIGSDPQTTRGNVLEAGGHAVSELGHIVTGSVQGLGKVFSPSGIGHLASLVANGGSDHSSVVLQPAQDADAGASSSPSASVSAPAPDVDPNRPMSLLGIINVGAQVGEIAGWAGVLGMLATVNIFLGLINLVPLLPFDGGHLAVSIYEEIRSRIGHRQYRVDMAKLLPVTYVALLLIGGLFLSTLYLDAFHPISIK